MTPWWRLFGAIFAVTFALIAIWSLAMPILSGPDEPAHLVRAAGAVRAEFVGRCGDNAKDPNGVCPRDSAFTEVHIPAFYSLARPGAIPGSKIAHHGVTCFARHPDISANCLILRLPPGWAGKSANAWTYVGRYPPIYYLVVGLPSLVGSGLWAFYLMRIASAAISALMLSLAVFSILRYSRSRILLLGVVIAATPMMFYLAGMVNPAGLEATSALAFFTTATIMLRECEGRPPRALLVMSAFSAVVFESARSLSALWIFLGVLCIFGISRWENVRALLACRDFQILVAVVVLVGLADVAWIVYEHSTNLDVASQNAQALIPPPGTSEFTILRTSFHHNIYYLPGMIGVFGAFDTYAPHATFVIWYLLGGVAFVLSLVAGSLRQRLVIFMVAIGILILPVLISSSQARRIGYVWSGRDTLPFAILLPLLGASVISGHRLDRPARRLSFIVLIAAWFAQVGALFWALRRYSVGERGPRFSFLFHPIWAPPGIGCVGVVIAEVVLLGLAYLLVYLALGENPRHFVPRRSRSNLMATGAISPGDPVAGE